MAISVIIVILSPYIISRGVSFLEEESLEGILIFLSLALGFFIFYLYQKEIKKHQQKLEDSFLYIGKMNVQLQELADAFSKIENYPINKKRFQDVKEYLLEKILGIVNVEWVMFRIIDIDTHQTIKDGSKARGSVVLLKCEISNKELLEGKYLEDYEVIRSNNKNLSIDTFCIIPKTKLGDNQLFMIKFIIKQLEQLFLLFTFIHKNKDTNKTYFKELE